MTKWARAGRTGVLGERFDAAVAFACEAHRHQVRKITSTPYVSHFLGAASLVLEHGGKLGHLDEAFHPVATIPRTLPLAGVPQIVWPCAARKGQKEKDGSSGQNPKVGCKRTMQSSGDQLEGRPVLATALTGLLAVSAQFSRPSARASQ